MGFSIWLLLGLIIGAIAFLVWDNAQLTKRAEKQASARTEPFPLAVTIQSGLMTILDNHAVDE